jgi:hypothetical protein
MLVYGEVELGHDPIHVDMDFGFVSECSFMVVYARD